MRRSATLLAVLAANGCAMGPPEPRFAHRSAAAIAAVRLDTAAAAAALNAYRSSKGLQPVRLDPALAAMADRQAQAMAAGDSLSHDVAGSFPSRLKASEVDTTEAGENLGGGYMSLSEAMAGWRGSLEHDANLILPAASRFGIAIAKNPNSDYGVYWAMEIAAEPRPRQTAGDGPFVTLSGAAARPQ
jgi:uncharacterized protein YkwD